MSLVLSSDNLRIHVIKLRKGEDIIEQIKEIAKELRIKAGFFLGIGAFEELHVAFYDQENKRYEETVFREKLEMTSVIGSISMDGDEFFIHCHVNATGKDSKALGGHVLKGSRTFAGEIFLIEIVGEEIRRVYDESSGLKLISK